MIDAKGVLNSATITAGSHSVSDLSDDGIDGDGVWVGTISDTSNNPALLNRKTYEVDGEQGAWTPTNLPEEGK